MCTNTVCKQDNKREGETNHAMTRLESTKNKVLSRVDVMITEGHLLVSSSWICHQNASPSAAYVVARDVQNFSVIHFIVRERQNCFLYLKVLLTLR